MLIRLDYGKLLSRSGPRSVFLDVAHLNGVSSSKLHRTIAKRLAMFVTIVFGLCLCNGCAVLPQERGSKQAAIQPRSPDIEQVGSVSITDQTSANQPNPIVKQVQSTPTIRGRSDVNGISSSNATTPNRLDSTVSQVSYQTPAQPQYEEITLEGPQADKPTLFSPNTSSSGGNSPPVPSAYAPLGTNRQFANRYVVGQNNGATQGYFRDSPNTQGKILAVPQVTASERATALLEDNNQLRREIDQAKRMADVYHQRLQQQDKLWESAKLEFVDVRNMLNQVNGENVLLKQQNEQLILEKDELTVKFQTLVQTVEQTLDEMLMKSFTEPPKQDDVPVAKEIPH